GLACGIGSLSLLTLFIISLLLGRHTSDKLSIILLGSCLGFLKYNFHPAKIFLGDTGSQFIGYMLASISIISAIKYATAFSIFIPVLAFGVPIYDTLSTIIRRKLNNRPIMEADRGHLHHRLLDKGYSHIQTVLIMYALTVILGIISIIVSIYSNSILVIIFVVLIVIIKIIKKT
ncbi:MAG: undecaprenyl/decaprenyl-phosphate alpha-N-acetylglucosaminyl 1-phosphate transferase, partial [Caloramator sp.]|nr:undecaprenyl/decaprenyl-phosphate alpha-N-acetylglucosaminyl 1-phosphate transferase [Caloramator sp.]